MSKRPTMISNYTIAFILYTELFLICNQSAWVKGESINPGGRFGKMTSWSFGFAVVVGHRLHKVQKNLP